MEVWKTKNDSKNKDKNEGFPPPVNTHHKAAPSSARSCCQGMVINWLDIKYEDSRIRPTHDKKL